MNNRSWSEISIKMICCICEISAHPVTKVPEVFTCSRQCSEDDLVTAADDWSRNRKGGINCRVNCYNWGERIKTSTGWSYSQFHIIIFNRGRIDISENMYRIGIDWILWWTITEVPPEFSNPGHVFCECYRCGCASARLILIIGSVRSIYNNRNISVPVTSFTVFNLIVKCIVTCNLWIESRRLDEVIVQRTNLSRPQMRWPDTWTAGRISIDDKRNITAGMYRINSAEVDYRIRINRKCCSGWIHCNTFSLQCKPVLVPVKSYRNIGKSQLLWRWSTVNCIVVNIRPYSSAEDLPSQWIYNSRTIGCEHHRTCAIACCFIHRVEWYCRRYVHPQYGKVGVNRNSACPAYNYPEDIVIKCSLCICYCKSVQGRSAEVSIIDDINKSGAFVNLPLISKRCSCCIYTEGCTGIHTCSGVFRL